MKNLIEKLNEMEGVAEICPQCDELFSKGIIYCDKCGEKIAPDRPQVKVKRILTGSEI
jgi:ribosomal protein L37AE/L43A